ncbi:hypothetical protein CMI37_22730 [Candidatus Pacearchaeota archaeon]|nr:hypothetical protein [Candidatus Pacearchaeota archaeon]
MLDYGVFDTEGCPGLGGAVRRMVGAWQRTLPYEEGDLYGEAVEAVLGGDFKSGRGASHRSYFVEVIKRRFISLGRQNGAQKRSVRTVALEDYMAVRSDREMRVRAEVRELIDLEGRPRSEVLYRKLLLDQPTREVSVEVGVQMREVQSFVRDFSHRLEIFFLDGSEWVSRS